MFNQISVKETKKKKKKKIQFKMKRHDHRKYFAIYEGIMRKKYSINYLAV